MWADMATYKVAELTGPLLDGAVAMAEGLTFDNIHGKWCLALDEADDEMRVYEPSQDWELGGPILQKARIGLQHHSFSLSGRIEHSVDASISGCRPMAGPTPLIAAMRAYVASRLGDTVELP